MDEKNFSPSVQKAAKDFEARLGKYDPIVQVSVGIVMANLMNGCSWGITSANNEGLLAIKDRFLAENGKVKGCFLTKLPHGFLVSMPMDEVLAVLNAEAKGLITQRELEVASEMRKKAINGLIKRMQSPKKPLKGQIGIYNLNDSSSITIDGEVFPSFAVTLDELIWVTHTLNYGFVLGNKIRTPEEVGKVRNSVLERLRVAPSGNALLIEVAPLR